MRRNPKLVGSAGLTPNRAPLDEIAESLREAPALAERLGLGSPTYASLEARVLGAGHYAWAFQLDNGMVLKVTDDPDDAEAAELIHRFKPTRGLPYIDEVLRFPRVVTRDETDEPRPRHLYAIVMETVQPITKVFNPDERMDLRDIFRTQFDPDFFEDEKEALIDVAPRKLQRVIRPVLDAVMWFEQFGFHIRDLHAGNIGFAAGNRVVLFDFGHGSKLGKANAISLDLASNGSLPAARRVFDECFDVIAERFPDFGDIELHEDDAAGADNGTGSDRQYGYCKDGNPIVIAFASKIESLPVENIRGLMRHEFGHALDYKYGYALERMLDAKLPGGVERRADVIAEVVFGAPIEYDARLVQCVGCGGQSPRPRSLQK